ncbi:MAG: hypothetical protein HYR84_01535 [Planctomycetes bacterium]|nr:hypothetical protein [Planctomycetota bacterium]
MVIRHIRQWIRKALLGGGTLAGVLLGWTGGDSLIAQTMEPGAPALLQNAAPVPRNYLSKSTIQLPIQINDQSRSMISEIQLHVKDHPSASWTLRDRVGPSARAFTFQAPRDGEYWFAMVTVDKQGRAFPNDLRNEPAGLVVVIDTQAPQIELTNLGPSAEGHLIQCDVRDSHLDPLQTRFFYQAGDKVFRPVDMVPGRPGIYCIPTQAVFTGVVRVTAEDLARNPAQVEMHVNQMQAFKAPSTGGAAVLAFPATEPKKQPDGPPRPLPTNIQDAASFLPRDPRGQVATGGARPDPNDGPRIAGHVVESSPGSQATRETLKRQFVNSTRVFLDYQVENAGHSGLGKVEVWITRDPAKTWHKLSEDTQRKGNIEVQFPGEGIFGVTLVASNARGVAGAAPAPGDSPDWWIEVDTIKPIARLTKAHSLTEDGKAVVHIHWNVEDKNLGDAPVDLFHSAAPTGPWLPIAKGLKAEGQYRWTPTAEIGAHAYIQLVARDAAGNSSTASTLDPVALGDPIRPRAVIRGISTGTTSPAADIPLPPPPPTAPSLPMPRF